MLPRLPRTRHRRIVAGAGLVALSIALYILSFLDLGLLASIAAFGALVPLFIFAERYSPAWSALAGAITGAVVMGFLCRWLTAYHFAAVFVAIGIGVWWYALAMTAISFLLATRSRFAFLAAGFIWCCSELGRSLGFLAFPYGTLPYAFVESRAALWLSSIGGVALVSLIVSLGNVSLFAAMRRLYGPKQRMMAGVVARASFGIACVVLTLAFGPPAKADTLPASMRPLAVTLGSDAKEGFFRVALVQACVYKQNSVTDYERAFTNLATLSDAALAQKPDLVVWHETAVVPPIEWHLRHRPDRPTYDFIRTADEYFKTFPVALLTGNGYAQPDDVSRSLEHNSALLYDKGSMVGRYDKAMLVPFSEYIPVWARLPALNRWLISRFGNYWTPGSGPTLLRAGNARFAAPICFEDSFGRYFSSFESPDFFVVLTNDSWANSAYMQKQHLAMSRFRAAETGAIVLRAADTGSTSAIAANGAIVQALEPFEPGVLVVDIPLGTARITIYEKLGSTIDITILGIALALSILAIARGLKAFRIDKNDSI